MEFIFVLWRKNALGESIRMIMFYTVILIGVTAILINNPSFFDMLP